MDTDHWLLIYYAFSYQALEDVEKNIFTLRQTLSGDGEVEPNQEQVLQIALEICKEDVLSLFVQNLPSLGWEVCHSSIECDVIFARVLDILLLIAG
jgi:calcium binding protein 39